MISKIRQTEIQIAKPLNLKPTSFEAGIAILKFPRYKCLGVDSTKVKNGVAIFLLFHGTVLHYIIKCWSKFTVGVDKILAVLI